MGRGPRSWPAAAARMRSWEPCRAWVGLACPPASTCGSGSMTGPTGPRPVACRTGCRCRFAPLLRWVLAWWQGSELTLDCRPHRQGRDAGGPGCERGPPGPGDPRGLVPEAGWPARPLMPDLCHLLDRLGPAVPSDMTCACSATGACTPTCGLPPGLAPLHRPRPDDLPGDGPRWPACALRGSGRPVHAHGREGLPGTQARLHPDRALGPRPGAPLGRAHGRSPRRRGARCLRPARLDRAGLPQWVGHRTRRRDPTRVDRHWLVRPWPPSG